MSDYSVRYKDNGNGGMIGEGNYKGLKFRVEYQPFSACLKTSFTRSITLLDRDDTPLSYPYERVIRGNNINDAIESDESVQYFIQDVYDNSMRDFISDTMWRLKDEGVESCVVHPPYFIEEHIFKSGVILTDLRDVKEFACDGLLIKFWYRDGAETPYDVTAKMGMVKMEFRMNNDLYNIKMNVFNHYGEKYMSFVTETGGEEWSKGYFDIRELRKLVRYLKQIDAWEE